MSESLQVAVRVRPLNDNERDSREEVSTCNKVVSIKSMDQAFTYTQVFGRTSTQDEVFSTCVRPLLPNLFAGFNLTILAYGQTGSGKTYTMGTAASQDGIITKAVNKIFSHVDANSEECQFSVSVSFLELYMEEVRDLLSSATNSPVLSNLDIREDRNGNVLVPGLTEVGVSNTEEALSCLAQGSQYRKTGATAMNLVSSRSHAVFTIKIESKFRDGRPPTVSKFSLVDLAGSERAKKTGTQGERMQEGIDINKGLLALGNVIGALSEQKKGRHIPYRDSKLTRLLQDSLGGNSHTLMIACVSPSSKNLQETLSTLRYATRALKIKNKPVVNMDTKAAEISELQLQVRALQGMLEQEKLVKARQMCPPGHQRLISIVKQTLDDLKDGSAISERIKNSSPMTKDHLRHIGVYFDGDDSEMDTFHSLSPTGFYENPLSPQDDVSTAETEQEYEHHQAQLNTELKGIEWEIQNKEAEINGLCDDTNAEYEEKCQNLLRKVEDLQTEKERLEKQLAEAQSSNSKASAMLAEQRRQQIKELERRIMLQKRELAEIATLREGKKKDKEKITSLGNDIQSLKTAKVKLAKEIKKSAENYRTWKQSQEREVGKLKAAAARGKFQMENLTRKHAKEHNVLKRKFEEAMASNKRLQAIINIRKPNDKLSTTLKPHSNNPERLQKWLMNEIEIARSKAIHREALNHLIAEKDRLHQKKISLKSRKAWEDPATKRQRQKEISCIESEISIQTGRIQELEKIISEESDHGKGSSHWTHISNLSDARVVMESLMNSYIEADRDLAAANERLIERESSLESEIKHLREQLKQKQEQDLEAVVSAPGIKGTPQLLSTPVNTPAKIDPAKTFNLQSMIKSKRKTLFFCNDGLDDESEEEIDIDNPDKDPDWRNTPFQKQQLRSRNGSDKFEVIENIPKKVSVDKKQCKCTGKCDTNRCGCRKSVDHCSENCNCNPELCRNKFAENEDDEIDEETEEMLNSTPLNTTFEVKKRKSSGSQESSVEQNVPANKKRRPMFTNIQVEFSV